jgi:hypothetical protein
MRSAVKKKKKRKNKVRSAKCKGKEERELSRKREQGRWLLSRGGYIPTRGSPTGDMRLPEDSLCRTFLPTASSDIGKTPRG